MKNGILNACVHGANDRKSTRTRFEDRYRRSFGIAVSGAYGMLYERPRFSQQRLHALMTNSPSELNGFAYAKRTCQLFAAVQQRPFADHCKLRFGASLNNLSEGK